MMFVVVLDPFPVRKDVTVHQPLVGTALTLRCSPPPSYPPGDVYWGVNLPGPKLKPVQPSSRIALDYDGM